MKKKYIPLSFFSFLICGSVFADCPDVNSISFDISGTEIKFSIPDTYVFGSFVTQIPNQKPDPHSRIRFNAVEFMSDETSDSWETSEITHFARVIPSDIDLTCKYEIGFKNYLSIKAKPDILGRFFRLTDYYDRYDDKAHIKWTREGGVSPYLIRCTVPPISYAHELRRCKFEEVDAAV